jgi:hypothetical protein
LRDSEEAPKPPFFQAELSPVWKDSGDPSAPTSGPKRGYLETSHASQAERAMSSNEQNDHLPRISEPQMKVPGENSPSEAQGVMPVEERNDILPQTLNRLSLIPITSQSIEPQKQNSTETPKNIASIEDSMQPYQPDTSSWLPVSVIFGENKSSDQLDLTLSLPDEMLVRSASVGPTPTTSSVGDLHSSKTESKKHTGFVRFKRKIVCVGDGTCGKASLVRYVNCQLVSR